MIAVALGTSAAASSAHAQEQASAPLAATAGPLVPADPDRRLGLDAFLWTTTPVALRTGMALGGGLDLRRAIGDSGLFLGARLAGASTSEATAEWTLRHIHGLLSLDGGIERRIGAGVLRAELGVGAMVVGQLGQRQQYERLKAAGLTDDLRRDGWSLGPWASLDLGAAIVVYDPWRVFVQLGPAFTVQRVAGNSSSRWIFSSGLGVGRAF